MEEIQPVGGQPKRGTWALRAVSSIAFGAFDNGSLLAALLSKRSSRSCLEPFDGDL